MIILWRCVGAVVRPTARRVQTAVATGVLSLVMLDAIACLAVRGVFWAALILLLLPPTLFLGRWIKMT